MTVAPASPKDRIALNADGSLSGRARGVPFAGDAGHFAVLAHNAGGSRSRWSRPRPAGSKPASISPATPATA